MLDLLFQLLAAAGGGAIVMALVLRGGARWVADRAAARIDVKLQHTCDRQLEDFRTELRLGAFREEVRFTRLHERRAEIIADLYARLRILYREAESLANPFQFTGEPDKKEKFLSASKALTEYAQFYDRRRIFFPPELCDTLEKFARLLQRPMTGVSVFLDIDIPTESTRKETAEMWAELRQIIKADAPAAMAAIEDEFRKLLGALPEVGSLAADVKRKDPV